MNDNARLAVLLHKVREPDEHSPNTDALKSCTYCRMLANRLINLGGVTFKEASDEEEDPAEDRKGA